MIRKLGYSQLDVGFAETAPVCISQMLEAAQNREQPAYRPYNTSMCSRMAVEDMPNGLYVTRAISNGSDVTLKALIRIVIHARGQSRAQISFMCLVRTCNDRGPGEMILSPPMRLLILRTQE